MQADFLKGVSFLKREDESLYDYWLSFSPMAPFFGVPWRFAPAATASDEAARPAARTAPPAADPEPAAKRHQAPAQRTIELVGAAQARPAPSPKPAQAPEPAAPEAALSPEPALSAEAEAEAPAGTPPALLYDPAPARADDLKRIKGVGPKLEAELNGMGLYTFAQVAALTPANLEWIDGRLTTFRGRSVRDDWVGQAATLLKEG